MPKATKTSRKASPTSTKKSGLKRRFDLTNKKVQFFVVAGIIAILGGGYFTIKSFAATGPVFQPQDLAKQGQVIKTETSSNKSGASYVEVASNDMLKTYYSNKKQIGPGEYRVCATSRATATGSKLGIQVNNNGSLLLETSLTPPLGSNYLGACSKKYLKVNKPISIDLYVWAESGSTRLTYINFELVKSTPTAPTPAPAPTTTSPNK